MFVIGLDLFICRGDNIISTCRIEFNVYNVYIDITLR